MPAIDNRKLAQRWAPIHYQEISTDNPKADFILKMDFGGTWKTRGAWARLDRVENLTGAAYYSVTETMTHWYIVYAFYHPRDWDNIDQHENDMEGFISIVQKPLTKALKKNFPYGIHVGMITIAHNNFYSYSNVLTSNRESVDDGVKFEKGPDGLSHPCTYQEPMGHGCTGFRGMRKAYVRYAPAGPGQSLSRPENITPRDGEITRQAFYELIDIMEPGGFWERRWGGPIGEPFVVSGQIEGGKFAKNAANPPWRWEDNNDGPDLKAGGMAFDPAYLAWQYFSGHIVKNYQGFFSYKNTPYIPMVKKIYGQNVNNTVLKHYLNSSNEYERFSAASMIAARNSVDPKVISTIISAMNNSLLTSEAMAIAISASDRNESFRQAFAPHLQKALNGPVMINKPEKIIPFIRIAGRVRNNSIRNVLIKIYKDSENKYVRMSAAGALISFTRANDPELGRKVLKDMSHSTPDFIRQVASRLYLKWYVMDDIKPLMRLTAARHSSVRKVAVECCKNLAFSDAKTILDKRICDSSWDIKIEAARMLFYYFGANGKSIINRHLKDEYKYAQKVTRTQNINLKNDFTDCPKKAKDYGRLFLIASLAEGFERQ
ncbi:MAG: hypothetical protein GY839_05980 [candidate division Zixibacteria bacterium]|nr:hypothetical protein [candidate division Zixibacteria bacterium]